MATRKTTTGSATQEVQVIEVRRGVIEACLIGTSPLICNAMSAKARQQLLLPPAKKNLAERATTLKHDVLGEFRGSIYTLTDEKYPTLIGMLASAFKGGLRNAALDLPGSTKSQIGRLTYVEGDFVGVYGIPQLLMSTVRQADMSRTPDVRTRAIIPRWACSLTISFVQPLLKRNAVVNLLACAGITQGLGDWRPEKGNGSYGQFQIVDPNDAAYKEILKNGGREAQARAMDTPTFYDSETERLYRWYTGELQRREMKVA
jgi:hypothetical protein